MGGRIWRLLATPIRGLHQAAYWLAILALASQALALIRDRTFAHIFGASHTLDLYYAAFKIPDLVFMFVASLVSAFILIPRIANDSQEDARTLISNAVSFLLIAGGAISIVIAVAAPQILFVFFPTFEHSSQSAEFVMLVRLLLLQPILLGLSVVFASVTQVHRKFIIYSLAPVLYNLGIIFGAIVLYPSFGLIGIGYGVVLGAIAYISIHIPIVVSARLMPRLVWPSWSVIGPVMRDSFPRTLALGVGSIVILIITMLAARAGSGIISVFTFATNLEAVPLALIGSSYAVAAFPVLSELSGGGNKREFTKVLSAAGRHLVLWSTVVLMLVIVLRAHIVRVILGTGNFNWNDTRLTAATLALLAIGLAAQGLILLLSRALYASRQSWRPLFYQLVGGSTAVAIATGGLFYLRHSSSVLVGFGNLLRVGNVSGNIVLVFALSVMVGQIVTAVCLMFGVRTIAPGFNRSLARPFFEGLLAAFVGSSAAYGTLVSMGNIMPLTTLASVFTQGLTAGITGLVVSASMLALLKNKEFKDMRSALHHFIIKRRALPTFDAS